MKAFLRGVGLMLGVASLVVALQVLPESAKATIPPAPSVVGSIAGPTPFIADVSLSNISLPALTSVRFSVRPMAGSTTTPISATYPRSYFVNHPADVNGSTVIVPVFGLYASALDSTNTVTLTVTTTSAVTNLVTTIVTTPWQDPCGGCYTTGLTYVHTRNNAIHLGYSYFMLKSMESGEIPIEVMDTDGQVRWIGEDSAQQSGTSVSGFFNDVFYATHGAALYSYDLDGSSQMVHDYSGYEGINNFWHNIDPGKTGMLLAADGVSSSTESTVLEVSPSGSVIKLFDLYQIISQAMTAGGDDPSQFVSQGGDWFHLNAATYWPSRNELVVSSRENFVIGINYDTEKIDWILGDPTKQWYQFRSLRHFALRLAPGTLPPIGQHAVSITPSGQLLLFNDGYGSANHSPAGVSRSYSFPQMFQINFLSRTARQTWAYYNNPPIESQICSSVYQVAGNSYLVDYADELSPDLIGLGPNNAVAFDYQLPGTSIDGAWNAFPVDLSNLTLAN